MKTIEGRLSKLERRFGIARTQTTFVVVLMDAGTSLGPAQEAYIKSLQEAESHHGSALSVVDITKIPSAMMPAINVVLDEA